MRRRPCEPICAMPSTAAMSYYCRVERAKVLATFPTECFAT
jgi:hypothetical protein